MKREIHERPLSLAKNHLLRVGDQSHRGDVRVLHDFVHTFQLLKQITDVDEVAVGSGAAGPEAQEADVEQGVEEPGGSGGTHREDGTWRTHVVHSVGNF
jgi:hypothetical protein